ncbi:MAG: SDR family NAD(P)-dependent oxidoreductase [Thermodesulfobacteriota bacterium]
MKLKNRTILITGGSSGIGKCLADQLHDSGNRVIVVSRSAESSRADDVALSCDLTDECSVIRLADLIKSRNLEPSILINNAAIQSTSKFTDHDFNFNTIQSEVTLNFTAVAWLTSLLLPILRGQESSAIVNISSGLALYPKTSSAVYCATKAALHSFSQSLRYQLEGTNVSVHEALLALVDTPMTHGRGRGKMTAPAAAASIIAGLGNDKNEIYVGKARYLPVLARISPWLTRKILNREATP